MQKASQEELSIEDHFSTINLTLQQKMGEGSKTEAQIAGRKQKMVKLEQLLETAMAKCSAEKEQMKQKIGFLKNCVFRLSQKESLNRNKARIKLQSLTNSINQQLNMHSQVHDMIITQTKTEFNKTLCSIQEAREKIICQNKKDVLQKMRDLLNSQLQQGKNRLENQKNLSSKEEEEVLLVLDQQMDKWRRSLKQIRQEWQNDIKTFQQQVETAKMEISAQLSEQRKTREQNKQKMLSLLQNSQKMGKSFF